MTKAEVRKRIKTIFESQGYELNVPIEINYKATEKSPYGKTYYLEYENGHVELYKFVFSNYILKNGSEKDIEDTVIHEACHGLMCLIDPSKHHGHDAKFRRLCKELGTSEYKTHFTRGLNEK